MSLAEIHKRLDDDLEFFCEHANMVVQDKRGELVQFKFNTAQRYIHDMLEAQRKKFGWVRALLLKGRQQGGSTYIEVRGFHKLVRKLLRRAFILSHETKTTDNLFGMVRRLYENMRPEMRPALGADNPRQMSFPALDANYAAATAGNEQAGRGTTSQFLHGSEAAYWKAAYAILDGALQSIALIAGTEIILESTANGPVGLFYDMCKRALTGAGDFILIFVPWFWQEEYEREPMTVQGFDLPTDEEEQYMRDYFTKPFYGHAEPILREKAVRKMAWRRAKVLEMAEGNSLDAGFAKFRAIYPSNPIEAFLSTAMGLIRADAITAARAKYAAGEVDEFAARIAGVDPAGEGKKSDRTIITIRQGRRIEKVIKYPKMKPMELAGIIAKLIADEDLDMVFVDRGYGEGTIDRLHELGFGRKVIGVAFNERPTNPLYLNKRAEIIIEFAKMMNAGGMAIPDGAEQVFGPMVICGGDEIHADFAAMPLDKETSNGVKFLPPKEQIVKEFGRSYDILDSAALTMAYPVRRGNFDGAGWKKAETKRGGPLSTMNRRRGRG